MRVQPGHDPEDLSSQNPPGQLPRAAPALPASIWPAALSQGGPLRGAAGLTWRQGLVSCPSTPSNSASSQRALLVNSRTWQQPTACSEPWFLQCASTPLPRGAHQAPGWAGQVSLCGPGVTPARASTSRAPGVALEPLDPQGLHTMRDSAACVVGTAGPASAASGGQAVKAGGGSASLASSWPC